MRAKTGTTTHRRLPAVLASLLAVVASIAHADHPLPLWQIDGDDNRIYLLGSVHLLREQDYPLPSALYDAYEDAEVLVMELDMDDLDPALVQALVQKLGMSPDGNNLAALMGPDYDDAAARATELELPLAALGNMEPWLAAISVEQLMLQRIGFDPAFGVEAHLVERAVGDGKEVLGLEEADEQLGILDGLSLEAQRQLLLQTLSEAGSIETLMDGMIKAWRNGDTAYLEENMLEDLQGYPEIYAAIVTQRNRDWVGQIQDMLDDQNDYLVVVGALHLVGPDSVPEMLRKHGHSAVQLQQPGETL